MARLTKLKQAQWAGGPRAEGDWLVPGVLTLVSGSAELVFDSGARIVLQGASELELVSVQHARLKRGMATAHIPDQAAGFQLETPSTVFSDQDVSFSLAVDLEGETEIHVLRGLLEATPSGNRQLARVLSGDESLRMTDSAILGADEIKHEAAEFDPELPVSSSLRSIPFLHWSFDDATPSLVPEVGVHDGESFPARIPCPAGDLRSRQCGVCGWKIWTGDFLEWEGGVSVLSISRDSRIQGENDFLLGQDPAQGGH